MSVYPATEIHKVNDILDLLDRCSQSDGSTIAKDHLEGALLYLVGAMNDEYAFNLDLARRAVADIPEEKIRAKAERILDELLPS